MVRICSNCVKMLSPGENICTSCGAKNEDLAKYCVTCGHQLKSPDKKDWVKRVDDWGQGIGAWGEGFGKRVENWAEDFPKNAQEECFGLPHSGLIFGLIIGIIIILVGVLSFAGIDFWRSFWGLMIIIFGALIFSGALYSLKRKR